MIFRRVAFVSLVAILALTGCARSTPSSVEGICIRVIDGDTIKVSWDGETTNVRLIGIDCPETRNLEKLHDQAADFRLTVDATKRIGEAATTLAEKMLQGKHVVLTFPSEKPEEDFFGRTLAFVEINDMDVGAAMISKGLAYARHEPQPRRARYRELERQAAKDGLGIHAGGRR